jgi:hypothetical protein
MLPSLLHWQQYTARKRGAVSLLTLYRAMHPIPQCSLIARAFTAWHTVFVPASKSDRRLYQWAIQYHQLGLLKVSHKSCSTN